MNDLFGLLTNMCLRIKIRKNGVTPEWLLSGIENTGDRGNKSSWYVIDKKTDMGYMISTYHDMNEGQRERLLGYMEAMMALAREKRSIRLLFVDRCYHKMLQHINYRKGGGCLWQIKRTTLESLKAMILCSS